MITISAVIPMYNSEDTIISCVKSVVEQSENSHILEVIVVNDGSTDESEVVLRNWITENKINFPIRIITTKNGGVSQARNIGINEAKGEWIAFLDSDDVWTPDKLKIQVDVIKCGRNILFLGANRNSEIHKYGEKVGKGIYRLNAKMMLFKPWPHTSTIIVLKKVLEEFDLFDTTRSYCEDIQLWMKIANKYGAYYLEDSLEYFGNGKPSFGYSGLSANLSKMHQGMISNIHEAYSLSYISYIDMKMLILWENIKYGRRIILTRFYKGR